MLAIDVLQVYLLTILASLQIPRTRPEALQDVVEEMTPAGATPAVGKDLGGT